MDNATKDLIADMIESGQGAITGRARTWLNSQVAHALATALAEREGERAEIARLREGLAWYANQNNWRTSTVYMCGHSGTSNVTADGGKRARATHSGETQ